MAEKRNRPVEPSFAVKMTTKLRYIDHVQRYKTVSLHPFDMV